MDSFPPNGMFFPTSCELETIFLDLKLHTRSGESRLETPLRVVAAWTPGGGGRRQTGARLLNGECFCAVAFPPLFSFVCLLLLFLKFISGTVVGMALRGVFLHSVIFTQLLLVQREMTKLLAILRL